MRSQSVIKFELRNRIEIANLDFPFAAICSCWVNLLGIFFEIEPKIEIVEFEIF